jgi:hypothetical protein
MAVAVVDHLEIVQVQHHQRKGPPVPARPADRLVEQQLVAAAVEQARQGIVAGVVGEQVQSKGQLDQARKAGCGQRPDDGRFGVQARATAEGGRQIGGQRLAAELERSSGQAENLVAVGPVHHDDQVTQAVASSYEIERLVDELQTGG